MTDITKKLRNSLATAYRDGANNIGAEPDMTTWMARKLAQQRATEATSNPEVPLYDGGDLTHDARNYLRDVPD
jgi:hypothetical protein